MFGRVSSMLSQQIARIATPRVRTLTSLPYLSESLEPQGVHKLADPDSSPMVSTKQFPMPGNTEGAGLWECTPGTWHITRTTTETFLVLAGRATLTEADGSVRVQLEPGLWHTTPAGWIGRWEVHEATRKLFVLTP